MKLPRWSLRTSLILIVVAAVVLSLGVAERSRLQSRVDAVRAIDEMRGSYAIRIVGPDWYRKMLARLGYDQRMFWSLERVSFGPWRPKYDPQRPFRDADLQTLAPYLAVFPEMQVFEFQETEISDRGVA